MRIVLTLFAVPLLQFPYLKLIGSIVLLWIGVRTILIADLVMSLDNVIAVAAAANNAPVPMRMPLLVAGLGLSIPLIIFGRTLLLRLMQRFPLIIALGAALLTVVAGEMAVTELAIQGGFDARLPGMTVPVALACGLGVVLVGKAFAHRAKSPPMNPEA